MALEKQKNHHCSTVDRLMDLARILFSTSDMGIPVGKGDNNPRISCVLAICNHAWTGLMAFPTCWNATVRSFEMTTDAGKASAASISHGENKRAWPLSFSNNVCKTFCLQVFKWQLVLTSIPSHHTSKLSFR